MNLSSIMIFFFFQDLSGTEAPAESSDYRVRLLMKEDNT